MRGSNLRSGYNVPSTIIPEAGQSAADNFGAPCTYSWYILQEDERGSYFANKSCDLEEKSTSLSRQAFSAACTG